MLEFHVKVVVINQHKTAQGQHSHRRDLAYRLKNKQYGADEGNRIDMELSLLLTRP